MTECDVTRTAEGDITDRTGERARLGGTGIGVTVRRSQSGVKGGTEGVSTGLTGGAGGGVTLFLLSGSMSLDL